jgi:hypothetical protein
MSFPSSLAVSASRRARMVGISIRLAWLATIDLDVKSFRPIPKDEDMLVEGWITNKSQALMYSEANS